MSFLFTATQRINIVAREIHAADNLQTCAFGFLKYAGCGIVYAATKKFPHSLLARPDSGELQRGIRRRAYLFGFRTVETAAHDRLAYLAICALNVAASVATGNYSHCARTAMAETEKYFGMPRKRRFAVNAIHHVGTRQYAIVLAQSLHEQQKSLNAEHTILETLKQ